MAAYSGFAEDSFDNVFIILDKMDKIGIEGVREELLKAEFDAAAVSKYMELFENLSKADDQIAFLKDTLGEDLEEGVAENLAEIFAALKGSVCADCEIMFDPTLVRGMSYYTGTIFEIEMNELNCSVAGGGRYDKMIGRFTGNDTPACGFSIGFERIITILLEKGFTVPGQTAKTAFLVEKGMASERMAEIIKEAQALRADGQIVLIARMNKNKKFQKEQLMNDGYTEFKDFYREALKN